MEEALEANQLIIGWSEAKGLLDASLEWEAFREILRETYYAEERDLRRAGSAAGNMWRFIREMEPGDFVVCPSGPEFYVAKITGKATWDERQVADDTAYRRRVQWLNDKRPIPRALARAALQSRMKTQGTCSYAEDLVEEIEACLEVAARGETPRFAGDLKRRLVGATLEEIRSGRLDSYGFEKLVASLMSALGSEEPRIVPRPQDKGADIVATFHVAGAFQFVVAVQAKHYQPEPPVGAEVIEQLIRGIDAESANLGMVVTSGSFSDDATRAAETYFENQGVKIELVDGAQLAALIVEGGLRPIVKDQP